jgi:hypothetical protein
MNIPEALNVLGPTRGEGVAGLATGVALGLNPDMLYGRNPDNFAITDGQNRIALVTTKGFVGTQLNGPQPVVSRMAEVATSSHQGAAEGGIALAGAFLAAGAVRAFRALKNRRANNQQ